MQDYAQLCFIIAGVVVSVVETGAIHLLFDTSVFQKVGLRHRSLKNVNARAVDFRGNLFGLRGISLTAVTEECG